MYKVYIIRNQKDNSYYFGHTQNLEERLNRHNTGKVRSTKSRVPFIVIYTKEFSSKSDAYKRELFFKSFEGRVWLKSSNII